jgi:hypothetical protein
MAFLHQEGAALWATPHYFRRDVRQLGSVGTLVFDERPHDDWKLDLCLAFAPEFFTGAKLRKVVERTLRDVPALDFRRESDDELPVIWNDFREECRSRMKSIEIADLGRQPSRERDRPDADRPFRSAARFAQRIFAGDPKFTRTSMNRSADSRRSRAVPACD